MVTCAPGKDSRRCNVRPYYSSFCSRGCRRRGRADRHSDLRFGGPTPACSRRPPDRASPAQPALEPSQSTVPIGPNQVLSPPFAGPSQAGRPQLSVPPPGSLPTEAPPCPTGPSRTALRRPPQRVARIPRLAVSATWRALRQHLSRRQTRTVSLPSQAPPRSPLPAARYLSFARPTLCGPTFCGVPTTGWRNTRRWSISSFSSRSKPLGAPSRHTGWPCWRCGCAS